MNLFDFVFVIYLQCDSDLMKSILLLLEVGGSVAKAFDNTDNSKKSQPIHFRSFNKLIRTVQALLQFAQLTSFRHVIRPVSPQIPAALFLNNLIGSTNMNNNKIISTDMKSSIRLIPGQNQFNVEDTMSMHLMYYFMVTSN